jgi:hypothetical protein
MSHLAALSDAEPRDQRFRRLNGTAITKQVLS